MKNLTQKNPQSSSGKQNIGDRAFDIKQLDPRALTPESEIAQTFTSFFPCSWHFIYAIGKSATGKPDWRTETRYPITARRLYDYWESDDTLIGVRFGTNTGYGLLDIDKNSPYHPSHNYELFKGILHALEDIGLAKPIIVQSSNSEGLHVYYPLSQEVSSFGLACAIKACLKSHNYEIASGVLEIFPNTKSYDSNFNGHRLPLQTGSYILDDDLQIIGRSLNQFVETWLTIQEHQDIDLLKEAIDVAKANYQPPRDNRKSIKWREDLEKQIQQGWTSKGQSNELLLKMGEYARVFLGCADGEAIANYIAKTARATVGFFKFCGDIHRLDRKAKDIAKWCLEHRFVWGSKKTVQTNEEDSMSKKAAIKADVLNRISSAISELKQSGAMPSTIRGMAQAIAHTAKSSVETLYKPEYRKLWHPEFTESSNELRNTSCNSIQVSDSSQETPLTDIPIESTENSLQSTVTDNPLYEALGFSEMLLRGQELPKFAKSDVTDFANPQNLTDGDRHLHQITPPELVKPPQKSNDSMWIETHGRLAPPKTESAKVAIVKNAPVVTANAACLQTYQPPQNRSVSETESRIGYLKALLGTPILRKGKSVSEISRFEAELELLQEIAFGLEQFECDRTRAIGTENLQNC